MTNLARFTASDLPELLDKISKNSIGMNEYLNRVFDLHETCLLYTSPSPRDYAASRMPSSA